MFSLLFSDFLKDAFFIAKNLFLILDASLVIFFVYIFIEALYLRPKFFFSPQIKKKRNFSKSTFNVAERWRKILENAFSNPPESLYLAIIEADKLVDEVLENLGFLGESVAQKMEKLNIQEFKSLDELWQAHKIRNEIVHSPNFALSESEAQKVLEAYEKFLKEAGVM